jgi:uncharacterized membrane protein YtjA (UPF0391 family)
MSRTFTPAWHRARDDAGMRQTPQTPPQEDMPMLHYALVFLVIAIIAAVFGFGGIAGTAAGIAKILFVIFLILAIIAFFRRAR